jgi:CheY-like chemotaxis protein/nitrogen-specific signal transduction histidine kinase
LTIDIKGRTFIWSHLEDITEQKRAERAEQAKVEAELANRAKSAFLANMSHELRTPLNGILGYAQILKMDRELTTDQQEGVQIIQQCGEYLLTLINDILDISKLETGELHLYPSDFHFGDFLTHLTQLFQLRAQEKKISFVYEPLSRLPVGAHADEKRLRQILVHLLGNAVKFTDKGGVTLQVSYSNGNIHFVVEDTGIGVAPADMERIFLPFQQPSKQYNYAKVDGLGVGLPLTQKLVRLMGGEIQVQSTLGHGSTFSVTLKLPEIPGLARPKTQPPVILGFEGKPRVLLVVDDKWENRSVLVNLLRPLGFDSIEASNGQEALNIVHEIQPDLILTDLVMPVMDGFELARQIRKIPEISHIPIVALSASVLKPQQAESILAGCNTCLMKPVQASELLDALQTYLGITWIYEQPDSGKTVNCYDVLEDDLTDLIGPTDEQANTLYRLALTEELGEVVTEVDRMEQDNPQLTPFANRVRELAKEFCEEKICELIERFL